MSRSRKKNPFIGNAATSDKKDKIIANRKLRHLNKVILKRTLNDVYLKKLKEISDVWCMAKDGKSICYNPKYLRK